MMYRYGCGFPEMGGYGFGFEWIFMIIFWVLIIWAIIAIVRAVSGKGEHWHMRGGEDEAMRVLRERYAKGEIDKQEFEARKNDLMKQ